MWTFNMIVNIQLTWVLMWPNFVLFEFAEAWRGMHTPDTLSRKYSYLGNEM